MSSSKPRDALGRFSRMDHPMGDGGGNGNGIPSPDDRPHTDEDLPTGGPDPVDSPSTDQEGGDPGAGTDGTKPEDEGKSKVDRRDNDVDADKDTEALRDAVKLGLQQWVDSLTSRQDFNDATEAFRSAGIDIPVPSRPTRDSRTNGYTSTPESQPTARAHSRRRTIETVRRWWLARDEPPHGRTVRRRSD